MAWKLELTKEENDFLNSFKKDRQEPTLFAIRGTKREYGIPKEVADGCEIDDGDKSYNFEDFVQLITEQKVINTAKENDEAEYRIICDVDFAVEIYDNDENMVDQFDDIEDFLVYINYFAEKNFTVCYYLENPIPDTNFFLTEMAAQEEIEKKPDYYNNAFVEPVAVYGDPELEALWNILDKLTEEGRTHEERNCSVS